MGFEKPHSCLALLAAEIDLKLMHKTLVPKEYSYLAEMWPCKYLVQEKLTCLKVISKI